MGPNNGTLSSLLKHHDRVAAQRAQDFYGVSVVIFYDIPVGVSLGHQYLRSRFFKPEAPRSRAPPPKTARRSATNSCRQRERRAPVAPTTKIPCREIG